MAFWYSTMSIRVMAFSSPDNIRQSLPPVLPTGPVGAPSFFYVCKTGTTCTIVDSFF
jgi:hypothetical protein